MGKFVGRNDLCPCGSGKKYKKCCLGKQDNPEFAGIERVPEIYKAGRKLAHIKECIHPDKQSCSGTIIGAHSIQNNKILNKISDNGELFMPCPKPDIHPSLHYKYGRKEATVFTGFCGYHDKTVFQPIEDYDFTGTDEQVFLYIYRAFALEYHKKKEVTMMEQFMFKNMPSIANMPGWFKEGKTGNQMAVKDYEEEKKLFDNAIINEKYDVLTSFVWAFDGFSNFAATGGEAPAIDFDGNQIQDLFDPGSSVHHMYISVFPEKEKTYAIVAWFREYDVLFKSIRDKLATLSEKEKKNFINNTLVIACENIVIKPSAWDSLSKDDQKSFEEIYVDSIDNMNFISNLEKRLEKPLFDLFTL